MSANVGAALGRAEALELVVVPSYVSGFLMSPRLSCSACIMCISSGEEVALLCAAPLLPKIVLLGKVEQQSSVRVFGCVVVFVGCPL